MEKILTTLRNKQNLNLRHGLAPNIKSKTRQVNKIVFRKRKRVNVVPNALFLRDNLFIVYFVSRLFKETELVHVPVHSLSLVICLTFSKCDNIHVLHGSPCLSKMVLKSSKQTQINKIAEEKPKNTIYKKTTTQNTSVVG